MSEKVNIIIDGKECAVDKNANLLEALKSHGHDIPHFCYHSQLGVDGNCRMCLIEIKGKKRPQIACDTPVADGMEVCTDSELTRYVQRAVMELELINHPIDCPVCDQAGECSLQDFYMDYDGDKSRMHLEEKVEKSKRLDYGSGVVHDQERCVLCTRCTRFTSNYTKTNELGIQKRGDESRIVIFPGRPIDNRYAQCIVDVCPVGAMTSADFRFKRRVWHLKTHNSICQECSKGCNIHVEHEQEKYRTHKIYRYRPRVNQTVNDHFMCDHGRYSYKAQNENRLSTASIEGVQKNITDVLSHAKFFIEKHATKAVFVVSPSLSLEELYSIKKLAAFYQAKITAYSPSYIKEGDGDELLIKDDKASNRAACKLLNISQEACFEEAELVVLFNTKEFDDNSTLLKTKQVISIHTHEKELETYMSIPCASYTEREGLCINSDGVIQKMEKIIPTQVPNLLAIINALSLGKISPNLKDVRDEIRINVAAFSDVDLHNIGPKGVKLG